MESKMYEISLDSTVDSAYMKFNRGGRLDEIVRRTEKSVRERMKESSVRDAHIGQDLVRDFCSVYASLESKVTRLGIFSGEGRDKLRLAKLYSLYKSAVAMSNRLFDSNIGGMLSAQENMPYYNRLSDADFKAATDSKLIGGVLQKLDTMPKRNDGALEKYGLFNFFNTVRAYAKNEIGRSCHSETLNKLKDMSVSLKDFDFVEHVRKNGNGKKHDPKVADENVEKLPSHLPRYVMTYEKAQMEDVVGNDDVKEKLLASLVQVLSYDPVAKANPFADVGFRERLLLHGPPGTGKNFTVDAALNLGRQMAKEYGIEMDLVSIKKETRSMYMNRPARLLMHYAEMQIESNKPTINVLNEADSLFGMSSDGRNHAESIKLITDAKEVFDMTAGKNIVWWVLTNNPGVFESAIGDRFLSVEVPGAETPEQYAELLYKKLEPARKAGRYNLSSDELELAVEKFMDRKDELMSEYRVNTTSRGMTTIASQYVSVRDKNVINRWRQFVGMDHDKKVNAAYGIIQPVTFDSIMQGIDNYFDSQIRRKLVSEEYDLAHAR